MRSVRRAAAVFALAVVVLASGCGGDGQTYSVDETKAAFAEHGYALEPPPELSGPTERDGQAVLAPRGDAAFFVVVGTDSELDELWPTYERFQDGDSFDVRRANVAVFSDEGVPPSDRDRASPRSRRCRTGTRRS